MWLFTKYGFFSAVCARKGDGRHGQPPDPNRVMVRARMRQHLDRLKARFSDKFADCDVTETTTTDYRYRLFVAKPLWSQVLAELSGEMDYDNFKSEVARFQGSAGADYEAALHKVWSVMNRLQEE
jgi:hypothetical protein